MGTTLQHGIFLPAEGERNCYAGLASNWTILDGVVGGYGSHAANLTIHVTAADKEAWNGKADASALTAHTGNTTIHVTAEDKAAWNGKADASALTAHTGDTTIHVTAADKQAWNGKQNALSQTQLDAVNSGIDATKVQQIATNTSDISSLQSGKANDSDVVHKSRNETISGIKDFSDTLRAYNSNPSLNTASIWLKNSKVNRGQSVYGDQAIWFRDATDKPVTALISRVTPTGASALLLCVYNVDRNDQLVSNFLSFVKNLDGSCYLLPDQNNVVELGSTSSRLKNFYTNKINGLEPSSLSLPSGNVNDVIDISSYITALDGTSNSYTAPANGWISIAITGTAIAIVSSSWSDSRLRESSGNVRMLYPVLKNETLDISVIGTTLAYARFIPCQGNI